MTSSATTHQAPIRRHGPPLACRGEPHRGVRCCESAHQCLDDRRGRHDPRAHGAEWRCTSMFVDAIGGFLPQHRGGGGLDRLAAAPARPAGSRCMFQQDRAPPTMTRRRLSSVTRGTAGDRRSSDLSTPLSVVDVGTRRSPRLPGEPRRSPQAAAARSPRSLVCPAMPPCVWGTGCGWVRALLGSTILIIEHDLDLVRSVCSTITVSQLRRGAGNRLTGPHGALQPESHRCLYGRDGDAMSLAQSRMSPCCHFRSQPGPPARRDHHSGAVNGAGKTQLFESMSGMFSLPGSIQLDGEEISKRRRDASDPSSDSSA